MAVRRLGQIFVDLGFITDDQLEMLVEEQARLQAVPRAHAAELQHSLKRRGQARLQAVAGTHAAELQHSLRRGQA